MEHHEHSHHEKTHDPKRILTIRSHSGLSGDMLVAGLLFCTGIAQDDEAFEAMLSGIHPLLKGSVTLRKRFVSQIMGWQAVVDLPVEHEHRDFRMISAIIADSSMHEQAKILALETFHILTLAEAEVHGIPAEAVHFHEVGALDSILDICLTCELFVRLQVDSLIVSPLPLADGFVSCAHGILPVPAPCVLALLSGIAVRPFAGCGETVTPTAIALLRALHAEFGDWPTMRVEKTALVYGTKEFPNMPNGATFAFGLSDE